MSKKLTYYVHSTTEKVYIEKKHGCVARLCVVSAEFYDSNESQEVIKDCSFEEFKKKALERGYVVEDRHQPKWSKKVCT